MKLLLINSYFGPGKKRETTASTQSPPLGLGFIGTYVRDHSDCQVEIIDPIPQELSTKEILEKAKKADFIGLTCYTDTRFQCFDFAKKVKEVNPDCKLIVGGPHVYSLDRKILKYYPYIDLLVRGEGEETTLEIIENRPYDEILGITWKKDDKIIRNEDRPFIENIDSLYIDYLLLPLDRYEPDIEAPLSLRKFKCLDMISSRGCPFRCIFCANEHWKRTWRAVSPEELVKRMKRLVTEYGVEYFRFYDDLFTLDERRVLRFCELLKESKLDIGFRVLVRGGTRREVLKALKEAGCKSVGFGIESGSERILKRINKGVTGEEMISTIKDCKELGLWTVGSFIVSLPDATMDDFKKSLRLMKLLDTFQTTIHSLYPRTPFYNELGKRGEIDDDIWFNREKEGTIYYCKDHFPSANFYLKDLRWLSLYSQYYHALRCPRAVVKKEGLSGGLVKILKGSLEIPSKGRIGHIYRKLKKRPYES